MKTFSVLTSDLARRPELVDQIRSEFAELHEVMVTISPDGKITTFAPVMS